MSGWTTCHVIDKREWAPGLVTLKLSDVALSFEPGQFVNLGLDIGGERVKRAYSMASAPGSAPEFYVSTLPDGAFSPQLVGLEVGQSVQLETSAQGFFALRWLPAEAKELWLVATGTGLGPFVSLWRSGSLFPRFERVVLVHGVREIAHLGYRVELEALTASEPRFSYLPVLSRANAADVAKAQGALGGRITQVLQSGALEQRAGLALDAERSHLMLCGNPEMVKDVSALLGERGLRRHRTRAPGHITTEAYW
jgi:ferredoxin/flavodoxin---NADP+ reductase